MSKRSKIHNCFKVSRWELNNIEVNYSEYFYFEVFTKRYLKLFFVVVKMLGLMTFANQPHVENLKQLWKPILGKHINFNRFHFIVGSGNEVDRYNCSFRKFDIFTSLTFPNFPLKAFSS